MELFGFIEETSSDADEIITTWGIPAQSERLARRQARINNRIRSGGSCEITDVEVMGEGDLPGQSIYAVTTVCDR